MHALARADRVLKEWVEGQHPRDEQGQWTESGHARSTFAWMRAYRAAIGQGKSHHDAARHADQATGLRAKE